MPRPRRYLRLANLVLANVLAVLVLLWLRPPDAPPRTPRPEPFASKALVSGAVNMKLTRTHAGLNVRRIANDSLVPFAAAEFTGHTHTTVSLASGKLQLAVSGADGSWRGAQSQLAPSRTKRMVQVVGQDDGANWIGAGVANAGVASGTQMGAASSIESPSRVLLQSVSTGTSTNHVLTATAVNKSTGTDYRVSAYHNGTSLSGYDFDSDTAFGPTTGNRSSGFAGITIPRQGQTHLVSEFYDMQDRFVTVTGLSDGRIAKVRNAGGTALAQATESGGTATIDVMEVNASDADNIAIYEADGTTLVEVGTPEEGVVSGGDTWHLWGDGEFPETDGVWSWWGDPRAVHYGQLQGATNNRTYFGIVQSNGDIVVRSYDHDTGAIAGSVLFADFEIDDHDIPALRVLPSGKIQAFWSRHDGPLIYHRTTTNPEDVTAWDSLQTISPAAGGTITYPSPRDLSDRVILDWRERVGGFTYHYFAESTDGLTGQTFGAGVQLTPATTPYLKFAVHPTIADRLDYFVSNNHPADGDPSLYHFYRLGTSSPTWHKSDGSSAGSLPLDFSDMTEVWDAVAEGDGGWQWDLGYDADGNPRVLFATFTSTSDHRLKYGVWNGSAWVITEIVGMGGSIAEVATPQAEPFYSAGAALDPEDPTRVWVSIQSSGTVSSLWEYFTQDEGATWDGVERTPGTTTENVRPYVPKNRHDSLAVLFLHGSYPDYVEYQTTISGLPIGTAPPVPTVIDQTGGQSADGLPVTIDLTGLDLQLGDVLIAIGGFGNENAGIPGPTDLGWERHKYPVWTAETNPIAGVWGKKIESMPADTSVTFTGSGSSAVAAAYNVLAIRYAEHDVYVTMAAADDPHIAFATALTENMLVIPAVYAPTATFTTEPAGYENLQAREQAATWPMALATATKVVTGLTEENPGTFTPTPVFVSRTFTVAVMPLDNVPRAPTLGAVIIGSAWVVLSTTDFEAGTIGDTPVSAHGALGIEIQVKDPWGLYEEEWPEDYRFAPFPVPHESMDNDPSWLFIPDRVVGGTTIFAGARKPNEPGTEALGGTFRARAFWIGTLGGRGHRGPWVEFDTFQPDHVPAEPDLTLISEDSGEDELVAIVSAEAMTTPLGVTTEAEHFADENPFQFVDGQAGPANTPYRFGLIWSYTRATVAPDSGLLITRYYLQREVGEHPDDPPDVGLSLLPEFEYEVKARWITGPMRYRGFGGSGLGVHGPEYPWNDDFPEIWDANVELALGGPTSPGLVIGPEEPAGGVCEDEEAEGVTYEVSCDGNSVSVTLGEMECDPTDGVWWRIGRANDVGGWSGSETFLDLTETPEMLVREFLLLDRGVRFAIGWRRRIGGVWQSNTTFANPQVICTTPDVVPAPFFENPSGHPYTSNFTLEWDFRGLSEFADTDDYTYRVRHSPDLGESWETLEEAQAGMSFLVDFVGSLEPGAWQQIGVTAIDEDGNESGEVIFLFRRRSLTNISVRDFKNDPGTPDDLVAMHTGTGDGTDRMTVEHVPGLGLVARKNVTFPVRFEPGVWRIEDLGLTPLGSRGTLTFSERVVHESWHGQSKRFESIGDLKHGIVLCLTGDGSNKTTWSHLLVRRYSLGPNWGWTGSARAPGHSGGAAGVNAEYNRIQFGDADPFVYGRGFNLRAQAISKRLGTTLTQPTVGGSTNQLADIWYPSNTVSGQVTYTLTWEFIKVLDGWTLRYMVTGPDINTGWFPEINVPSLQVQNGSVREMPVGYLGLTAEDPIYDGEAVWHSLVVEEITEEIVGCQSDWRLTTFKADDVTPQYGLYEGDFLTGSVVEADYYSDRNCPRPYLLPHRDFSETSIDFPTGSSDIGQIRVGVVDKRITPDQNTGLLTALRDEFIGRRCLYERWREDLGYVTVMDGVCDTVELDESAAAMWLLIRDPRERERATEMFARNETFALYPDDGPIEPYGLLPNDAGHLIPPALPQDAAEWDGRLSDPGGDDGVHWGIAILSERTDEYKENILYPHGFASFNATTGKYEFRDITVRWRLSTGGSWHYLRNMPSVVPSPGAPVIENAILRPAPGTAGQWRLYMSSYDTAEIPTTPVFIDLQILAVNTTETTPFFWDKGTLGDLLLATYRGEFSESPPQIRYSEDALEEWALNTPRARFKATKPEKGIRSWVEKNIYAAYEHAPSFDEKMRLVPVLWELPPADEELVELDGDWLIPVGEFTEETGSVVNDVSYTYIVESVLPGFNNRATIEEYQRFIAAAPEQVREKLAAEFAVSELAPWERLLEEKRTRRYVLQASTELFGTKEIEYEPTTIRATNTIGEAIATAIGADTAQNIADRIGNDMLSRFGWGAAELSIGIRSGMAHGPGFDPYTLDLRVGQWVKLRASWLPNYLTGTRSTYRYMQITSLADPEINYRRLRLIDGGPVVEESVTGDSDDPDVLPFLEPPTFDYLSETADLRVEITVIFPADAPAGYKARVDYAVSDTEPSVNSGLWIPLGYLSAEGTILTPVLPAGSTVWIRARGEVAGRRPSAWTPAESVVLSDVPALLSVGLSLVPGEGGLAQLAFVPNDFAGGVEIEVSTGAIGHSPTFGAFDEVDADPSDSPVNLLGEEIGYGEELYARVTAWETFSLGSVGGAEGVEYIVRVRRANPAETATHEWGAHSDTDFVPPEERVDGMTGLWDTYDGKFHLGLVASFPSFVGNALKILRVNAAETAVEWWTLLVNLATQVTGLLGRGNGGTGVDFSSLTGHGTKLLRSNVAETAFELWTLVVNLATQVGSSILAVVNGGTGKTTSDLSGQANKAVVVNGGETGYTFTAKADATHTHAASDITSATLAVARGGTDKTTGDLSAKAGFSVIVNGGETGYDFEDHYTKAEVDTAIAGVTSGVPTGTSFPGSPSTDDLFYRTDRRLFYFYDGTRWLSTEIHELEIVTSQISAAAIAATTAFYAPNPYAGRFTIYVEELVVVNRNLAATPGTNFFTYQLLTSDGASETNFGSTTTGNGDAQNSTVAHTVTINAEVASTVDGWRFLATESGAASTIIMASISYRLKG